MQPHAQYRRNRILTATPGELIVMMYDGVLQRVAQAKGHCDEKRWGPMGEQLGRAQDILFELIATLNPEHAPELCDRLQWLYGYCSRTLLEAMRTQDTARLDEVTSLLRPLRDAWAEAARSARTALPMAVNG